MEPDYAVLGIDPASKNCAVCQDGKVERIASRELRNQIRKKWDGLRGQDRGLLIIWDSPLSFSRDSAQAYSMRPIEKATNEAIKAHAAGIASSAVKTRYFTGVSHWALTLDVTGIWINEERQGPDWADAKFQLVDSVSKLKGSHINVAEMHPAVTLAGWWTDRCPDETFPEYKGNKKENCQAIWEVIGHGECPDLSTADLNPHDVLDAWSGWKLGEEWLCGKARVVGNSKSGGFLLPDGGLAKHIEERLDAYLSRTAP